MQFTVLANFTICIGHLKESEDHKFFLQEVKVSALFKGMSKRMMPVTTAVKSLKKINTFFYSFYLQKNE
jgi:uncharacterized protein (DUF2236 family)